MKIGTVTEGPTDRLVIQAIIDGLIPGSHRYFAIQPSETLGELGLGWKGVRNWCRQTLQQDSPSLELTLSNLDLLVIHLDADIADEHDLQEENASAITKPNPLCPPPSVAAAFIREVSEVWLDKQRSLPDTVVFAIPSENTETWLFAALYSSDSLIADPDYECRHTPTRRPGYRLSLKKYGKVLSRDADGRIRKNKRQYEPMAAAVAVNWAAVCEKCSQAREFHNAIRAQISPD